MNIYFITGTILLLLSRFQKKQLFMRILSISAGLFFLTYCLQNLDYYYIALNVILLILDINVTIRILMKP